MALTSSAALTSSSLISLMASSTRLAPRSPAAFVSRISSKTTAKSTAGIEPLRGVATASFNLAISSNIMLESLCDKALGAATESFNLAISPKIALESFCAATASFNLETSPKIAEESLRNLETSPKNAEESLLLVARMVSRRRPISSKVRDEFSDSFNWVIPAAICASSAPLARSGAENAAFNFEISSRTIEDSLLHVAATVSRMRPISSNMRVD
mmetsp:Transcript_39039/g.125489  ORF Transcript_39039/g.125489 Transcript_39039/m.125489 type:complete len:215 (+) Transcript_39039:860-1504(+)